MIYLLLALSGILNGVAQLCWKVGLSNGISLDVQSVLSLLANPYFMGGSFIYATSILVWFAVLPKTEVSFAYPFLALSFVIVTLGGYFLWEHISLVRLVGIWLILVGIIFIARS